MSSTHLLKAQIELPIAKALAFLRADFLYPLSVLFEVEMAFHDYEKPCANHFCNMIGVRTLCFSFPSLACFSSVLYVTLGVVGVLFVAASSTSAG